MAFLTRLAFISKWNQRFRTNDLFEIDEADLRDFALDAVDTFGRQGNAARSGVKFVHSLYRADEPVAAVREELDPLSMCLGTICYSEFAPTTAEKVTVLVYDPDPTAIQVWLDGSFQGLKIGARWAVFGSEDAAGAAYRLFDPLDPVGYVAGEIVRYVADDVTQFAEARKAFTLAAYPAGYPVPTGTATDANWKPVSPPNPTYRPLRSVAYAVLVAALDGGLEPGQTYEITDRPGGGPVVYAVFDTDSSGFCEGARVQGQEGLWRYEVATDTLTLFSANPFEKIDFLAFTPMQPYTFVKGKVYNDVEMARAYYCLVTHTTSSEYPGDDARKWLRVPYMTLEAGDALWTELGKLSTRIANLPGKMPRYYATHANGTIYNGDALNNVAGSIPNDSGRVYAMGNGALTGDATVRYNNLLLGNDYALDLGSYLLLLGRGATIDKFHLRNGKLNLYGTTVAFFNEGSLSSTVLGGIGGQMLNLNGTTIDCPSGFKLVQDGLFVNWFGTAKYPNPVLPTGADVSGGTLIIHPYVAPPDNGGDNPPAGDPAGPPAPQYVTSTLYAEGDLVYDAGVVYRVQMQHTSDTEGRPAENPSVYLPLGGGDGDGPINTNALVWEGSAGPDMYNIIAAGIGTGSDITGVSDSNAIFGGNNNTIGDSGLYEGNSSANAVILNGSNCQILGGNRALILRSESAIINDSSYCSITGCENAGIINNSTRCKIEDSYACTLSGCANVELIKCDNLILDNRSNERYVDNVLQTGAVPEGDNTIVATVLNDGSRAFSDLVQTSKQTLVSVTAQYNGRNWQAQLIKADGAAGGPVRTTTANLNADVEALYAAGAVSFYLIRITLERIATTDVGSANFTFQPA